MRCEGVLPLSIQGNTRAADPSENVLTALTALASILRHQ
ncbi:hypothetical protein L917_14145 [Phytophthora nicotianae]|uniref:Uncharacterized protein n=1 Tax=Phytophthora nicotianae TaxID=4792 RepID=W2KMH2_PHYNI|nr:hypothetical protein L917_14145 [Phytophthora nicotianae]